MATAQEQYKELVSGRIWAALRPLGFKRQGTTFGLRGAGVWGIVHFQKNRYCTQEWVSFTINVGVRSDFLSRQATCGTGPAAVENKPPPITLCDWRCRIGDVTPARQDVWWEIRTDVPFECGPEIERLLLDHVLPALRQRRTDDGLLDGGGLRPMARALLTRNCRDDAEFQACAAEVLRELRGTHGFEYDRAALLRLGYLRGDL